MEFSIKAKIQVIIFICNNIIVELRKLAGRLLCELTFNSEYN